MPIVSTPPPLCFDVLFYHGAGLEGPQGAMQKNKGAMQHGRYHWFVLHVQPSITIGGHTSIPLVVAPRPPAHGVRWGCGALDRATQSQADRRHLCTKMYVRSYSCKIFGLPPLEYGHATQPQKHKSPARICINFNSLRPLALFPCLVLYEAD